MPKHSTVTKNSGPTDADANAAAHQRAALAALLHELEEVDELREGLQHARQAREARLALIEEIVEQIDLRIAEEVQAIEQFDAGYECGCGCAERGHDAAAAAADVDDAAALRTPYRAPAEGRSTAQVVFGVLSVGCAVASLATSWLRGPTAHDEPELLQIHKHEFARARAQAAARRNATRNPSTPDGETSHA